MKRRDPSFVIVASLLTVGIYTLYWLYTTATALAGEGRETLPTKVLLYPLVALLGLVVAVAPVDLVVHAGSARHIVDLELFPTLVIAGCLSEVALGMWWLWRFCGIVARYMRSRLTQAGTFWLFVLLAIIGAGWVWPGVIQGYLNSQSQASR